MSFSFNNDRDDRNERNNNDPFKEIAKIFHEMQKHMFNQMKDNDMMQNQDSQNDDPNVRKFGFSIHMGPDGNPHITPLNTNNRPKPNRQPQNQVEEPFVDAFYNEEEEQYQIIAEVPGIESEDVNIDIQDNDFTLEAKNSQYHYKKSMLLKHPIDPDTIDYEVRNGVLELHATAIPE